MARAAVVNGRRVWLPDVASADQIAQAGGVGPGRRLIQRTRTGNYPVDEAVRVNEGDTFVDAPQRVKG